MLVLDEERDLSKSALWGFECAVTAHNDLLSRKVHHFEEVA